MSLTRLQRDVRNKASRRLKSKKWYNGVCLDNFPTDSDIKRDGVSDCVDRVCLETELWDNW